MVNKALREKGVIDGNVEVIDRINMDSELSMSSIRPKKVSESQLHKMFADSATNHVSTNALTLAQTANAKIRIEGQEKNSTSFLPSSAMQSVVEIINEE